MIRHFTVALAALALTECASAAKAFEARAFPAAR